MLRKETILEYFDTINEPLEFRRILKKKLSKFLDDSETEYFCGRRSEILFNEEELQNIFIETDKELTENAFNSLLEKNFFSMFVNENGELSYKLSDLGMAVGKILCEEKKY